MIHIFQLQSNEGAKCKCVVVDMSEKMGLNFCDDFCGVNQGANVEHIRDSDTEISLKMESACGSSNTGESDTR